MTEQLERVNVQFANPVTGEVLSLASSENELGRYLSDLREFESVIREHKKMVTRELVARMDRQASWTIHAGEGIKLTSQSPKPEEQFDGAGLRSALLGLVDEGVLSIEAVDAAVELVLSYKAHKKGINALRALGGRAKALVDEHATEVQKERYVSVSRV